jgi:streptogrisin C
MRLSFSRRIAAVFAAVGVAVAFTLPHSAAAAPTGPTLSPAEHITTETSDHLRTALGPAFGGAWLTEGGEQWVVAITDPTAAGQVVAAGAQPQLVEHSEAQLDAALAELNRTESPPASVVGWYVDVPSNAVVLEVLPDGQAAAAEFIEASGVDEAMVRLAEVAEAPQVLQYPLRRGDPFYPNGTSRCTISFLARTPAGENGYITAGHCGTIGTPVYGFNMVPQGIFRGSVFPGGDYALVTVYPSWIPTPRPWPAAQPTLVDPPIGATVCKSGTTTGWTCGMIAAKNQTVNYPEGSVTGLTRTTMCAEPGDSGAPVYAGTQPYAMVSGGSGNCSVGGITFVYPIAPVLSAWNLQLLMY